MEYNATGATITTFRDAIWWAIVTTTTTTTWATVVMIVGIGLIGIVSTSVADWFVRRDSESGAELARCRVGES